MNMPPSFIGWHVHLLTELVGIETASGTDAGVFLALKRLRASTPEKQARLSASQVRT